MRACNGGERRGRGALRLVRAGRARARLRLQLRRPADPLDPRAGDQSRHRALRLGDRLPLRHGLRGLLRDLRHSARPARGRLGAQEPDRARPRVLERDDGALGHGAQLPGARRVPHRCRRRRGERVARPRSRRSSTGFPRACARRRSRSTRAASTSARASGSSSAAGSSTRWRAAYPGATARRSACAAGTSRTSRSACRASLLALWVATLREPRRGQSEGLPEPPRNPHPFREFGLELMAVLPPLTLISLWRAARARAGSRAISPAAVAIALVAAALVAAHRRASRSGSRSASASTRVLLGAGAAAARRADVRADLRHAARCCSRRAASRASRS